MSHCRLPFLSVVMLKMSRKRPSISLETRRSSLSTKVHYFDFKTQTYHALRLNIQRPIRFCTRCSCYGNMLEFFFVELAQIHVKLEANLLPILRFKSHMLTLGIILYWSNIYIDIDRLGVQAKKVRSEGDLVVSHWTYLQFNCMPSFLYNDLSLFF